MKKGSVIMLRKELGKISSVRFGYGGYQEAQFGLSISLECNGGSVSNFKGMWPFTMERHSSSEWTEADRERNAVDMVRFITETMDAAKVRDVADLKGIPVECEFDGQMLKSWRILSEVL